jgi:hypothetical protein
MLPANFCIPLHEVLNVTEIISHQNAFIIVIIFIMSRAGNDIMHNFRYSVDSA